MSGLGKTACGVSAGISKGTVMGSFAPGTPTRVFLDKLVDWEITSFIPETKTVCLVVYTRHGMNHLSLTLPTPVSAGFI